MVDIPAAVLSNLSRHQTVVFLGAGFSVGAGLPSAAAIAARLHRTLANDGEAVGDDRRGLDLIAERFELTYGRSRLVSELQSFLSTFPVESSPSHRLLATLVKHGFIKAIVTTNYDTLVEDACRQAGVALNVVSHESHLHASGGKTPTLFKIHGDFSHPELLVLTPPDLQGWQHRPEVRPLIAQIQSLLTTNALLFLGYSLSDFNILSLLLGSAPATARSPRHKHHAAVYATDQLAVTTSRLGQYGVEAFACPDVEAFLRQTLLTLPVSVKVTHLLFNYPSWYPDQQARYGGIETFINYLKSSSPVGTHTLVEVYNEQALTFTPERRWTTSSPTYPASFFFFRAAAKSVVAELLQRVRLGLEEMPDVVHMHFLAFAPLCEEAGLPTLCTSHSLLSSDFLYTKGVFDDHASPGGYEEWKAVCESERQAAASARFVTVISAAHEKEVREIGAASVRRVDVPFNPQEYRVEDNPASARQYRKLPDGFTVTFVGRPDRRKGVEIAVRACELVARDSGPLNFLLVGYGFHHEPGTITLAAGRYRVDTSAFEAQGGRVVQEAASRPQEAGVFYAASDVVVVPSLYEPMGYVVLEAMACGRAVVAARVDGIPETIVDGHNGLLFEPGDAVALATQILALRRDEALRTRLGRQARLDMEKRRPLQEIVKDWQELYRQAAFAADSSWYPGEEVLKAVREQCESPDVLEASVECYSAALQACRIVERVRSADRLPPGVPVDRALLRTVATELHKTLRNHGYTPLFSVPALTDIMQDLSLAFLNRDPADRQALMLTAEDTHARVQRRRAE